VDVSGLRVGVIGTGSSAIQSIPILASQAEQLTVFQRTPAFTLPAMNAPLDPDTVASFKARYREHREATRHSNGGVLTSLAEESALAVEAAERDRRFEAAWESGTLFGLLSSFSDLMIDPVANELAAQFVRDQIARIVDDPEIAERLSPRSFPIGTKRLCLDTNYYATYNRSNVELVDLHTEPIQTFTASGIRVGDREIPLDVIVFATGFDAMTGALLAPTIFGRDGITLKQKWAEGPRTYLGIATSGFPNLFTITGPGSPSVLTNMLVSIEQHVEWTAACIDWLDQQGAVSIEADVDAENGWADHVTEVAGFTLYPTGNSWYLGSNIEGKPRVFMPYIAGVEIFRTVCDDVAANGYRGFTIST
jgi:cyclohexanone monooxygenase